MIELTWKLFCQTGNIEAYLLLKELEMDQDDYSLVQNRREDDVHLDQKM